MSRALVLGGGGPVGIGWEAGLLVGLMEAGVDASAADAVVGTSAGSVVGFVLASGGELSQALELLASAGGGDPAGTTPPGSDPAPVLEQLMATVARAAADPAAADGVRAELGRIAEAAPTISEAQWLAMFAAFAGSPWPSGFACTAVDTGSGGYQLWDESAGVDPQLALASSCAVPGIYPPVGIGGRRWMDGGVRDMLNADAAAGHSAVMVVSCTLLELPEGFEMPAMEAVFAGTRAQIDGLRRGSRVEVIVPGPEMLEISGWGLNLMDFDRAGAAYQAGVRQGRAESGRLAPLWNAG